MAGDADATAPDDPDARRARLKACEVLVDELLAALGEAWRLRDLSGTVEALSMLTRAVERRVHLQ